MRDAPPDRPRTNYVPVRVDCTQSGWINPATGAYTPAVRVAPPGSPVGTAPPLVRDPYDR